MDRTPKEILALARARFDERHFAGSFDKVGAYVEDEASDPDIARVLSMERAIAKGEAEASIKEILKAIPGIVSPRHASDWFALRSAPFPIPPDRDAMDRPMGGDASEANGRELNAFADTALANLGAMQRPGFGGIAVKAIVLDGGTLNVIPLEVMDMTAAVNLVEGGLGHASQRSVAVCTILDLHPEVRDGASLNAARTFGSTTAPERIEVCFAGLRSGERLMLARPMGDAAGRTFVDPDVLRVIKAAYVTKG